MHPGNLVLVSYIYTQCTLLYIPCISSCIANTISLEQVMRDERRYGESLISLVYNIFPVFYTMKNFTKIASALKSVRSFSAITETDGFRLKSQTRLNTCILPLHYVRSSPPPSLVEQWWTWLDLAQLAPHPWWGLKEDSQHFHPRNFDQHPRLYNTRVLASVVENQHSTLNLTLNLNLTLTLLNLPLPQFDSPHNGN